MGRVHSIETFGTVDGPGIRFLVFFAGCPMRCLYCHNPDTWDKEAGIEMTADEILARFLRNRSFYKTGGITATGGEPLYQLAFLTEIFEKAKAQGIHTTLDTSGVMYEPTPEFTRLLASTDLVLLDIKALEPQAHRALTGCDNARILAFLDHLTAIGKPVWIRYVLVPGLTDREEQLEAVGRLLAGRSNLTKVEVLPFHKMGEVKYAKLGLIAPLTDTPAATTEMVQSAYEQIQRHRNSEHTYKGDL